MNGVFAAFAVSVSRCPVSGAGAAATATVTGTAAADSAAVRAEVTSPQPGLLPVVALTVLPSTTIT